MTAAAQGWAAVYLTDRQRCTAGDHDWRTVHLDYLPHWPVQRCGRTGCMAIREAVSVR